VGVGEWLRLVAGDMSIETHFCVTFILFVILYIIIP